MVNITLRVYRPSHLSFECIGGARPWSGAEQPTSERPPTYLTLVDHHFPFLSFRAHGLSFCTANKSDPFPQCCRNYKCKNKKYTARSSRIVHITFAAVTVTLQVSQHIVIVAVIHTVHVG